MNARPASLRLDRLLANMGYGSRRDVQSMVLTGLITLDGEVVARADQRLAVTADLARRMRVAGAWLDPPPPLVLMLHKPLGTTCSHKEAGPLVYDLLPVRWRRREPALSTVGRLDKDTSGLLLMTDDGGLLHRIISPKSHVAKRYEVTVARDLAGDEAAAFASGTLLLDGEDKPLLPAQTQVLEPRRVLLTIGEGRYHQVRRMFAAVGNHVIALHRDRVGGLDLFPDLAAGELRVLGEPDLARIFEA